MSRQPNFPTARALHQQHCCQPCLLGRGAKKQKSQMLKRVSHAISKQIAKCCKNLNHACSTDSLWAILWQHGSLSTHGWSWYKALILFKALCGTPLRYRQCKRKHPTSGWKQYGCRLHRLGPGATETPSLTLWLSPSVCSNWFLTATPWETSAPTVWGLSGKSSLHAPSRSDANWNQVYIIPGHFILLQTKLTIYMT